MKQNISWGPLRWKSLSFQV